MLIPIFRYRVLLVLLTSFLDFLLLFLCLCLFYLFVYLLVCLFTCLVGILDFHTFMLLFFAVGL